MAQRNLISKLADPFEDALTRLAGTPGASRVVDTVTGMTKRMDEMQKRLRGLTEVERKVAELEQRVAKLERAGPGRKTSPSKSGPARKTAPKKPAG